MPTPYTPERRRAEAPGAHRPRSERDLARYGYAGQGYRTYGEPHERDPLRESAETKPGWFGAASTAYAFGYATTLRPPQAVSAGHAGKGPKGYVRSDSRVREDVCERLSLDDEVDASEIAVSVMGGEVSLQGTVVDRYVKRRAEMLALSVRGTTDVHNELRVHKSLLRELGDKFTNDEHHGHQGSGTRTTR